jgi:membrane protease subunit HflK
MEKNLSKSGFTNWMVLLVAGGTLAVLARQSQSATAEIGAAFLALGFLVSLVSWFQMRLEAREDAERLEVEALGRSRNDSALFSESAAETFPARRAREQFEKWLVPVFTFLLFTAQVATVYLFYRKLRTGTDVAGSESATPLALAVSAGLAFVLFLFGRYAARLAQLESSRLLRPSASAVMLAALISAVACVAAGLDWAGFVKWDVYLAWGLAGLLAVVAVETLFSLILEIYRPRAKGKAQRVLYESRIIGVLGQSGGLFSTAAHALDYQFGFKVSETWFYQYLHEKLAGFALFWLAILWLSSSVVVIEPQEQGLKERFGRPVADSVLDSGLHFKLPWPIDAVRTFKTRELQSFIVGAVPDSDLDKERTLLWTRAHYREETPMLVASREQESGLVGEQAVPVNFLTTSIPVQFVVRDVKLWGYQHSEPARLLERIATREVVRYLASVDMDKVMSHGRLEAAQALKSVIQTKADSAKLGAEIVFVGLQDIHPPIGTKEMPVAAAYEQVIGAIAQKEAKILEAEGYRAEMLPTSQARATQKLNEAQALALRKTQDAAGRAAQFQNQITAYAAAPKVYAQRTYLDALTKALGPTRKLVVGPTNTTDVLQLNLEDKLTLDNRLYVEDPGKK